MRLDAAEWLRLCLVPGVSGTTQRRLLAAFGTPAGIAGSSCDAIAEIAGSAIATAIEAGPPPGLMAATLSWLEAPGHHLIALGDDDYPTQLLNIPDPPTVIYAKGNTELLNRPTIAIVGSRNATRQGALDATHFARALSDAGHVIASGLALGIDAAAHRGGLDGPCSSVAVVGTGLDRDYPAANRHLAAELACRGVLVSEFPLGTPPVAANFPRRNRIISGLSRGVLVVEAAMSSGSLTTARLAADQGREVFAIPGSIHSPLSRGCHWLIRQGAKLVEAADDILAELAGCPPSLAADPADASGIGDPILEALGFSPATLDALSVRTGQPVPELAASLTRLEVAGCVERMPGGLFRQVAVP